mmetsp:Transcript_102136/g.295513  ORF Transcript_102136/g.295513 Transcript_102136/m.295513 type:complete len:232 (-) Transcript_102136:472-1167(-)
MDRSAKRCAGESKRPSPNTTRSRHSVRPTSCITRQKALDSRSVSSMRNAANSAPAKLRHTAESGASPPSMASCTTKSRAEVVRMYVRPSSSGGTSHCPCSPEPHTTALPSLRRTTEWERPAATCATVRPEAPASGRSHWPQVLSPKALARPSLWTMMVWLPPAATWQCVVPGSAAGTSHCPWKLSPQATARPSLRSKTLCATPAATCEKTTPSGSSGMTRWPRVLSPQATA